MYNMFDKGSANNNVIDPSFASMQPDPNQVSAVPMNPVVVEDDKLKRQQAMLAALKGAAAGGTGNPADGSGDPWAQLIGKMGGMAAGGITGAFGGK